MLHKCKMHGKPEIQKRGDNDHQILSPEFINFVKCLCDDRKKSPRCTSLV